MDNKIKVQINFEYKKVSPKSFCSHEQHGKYLGLMKILRSRNSWAAKNS